EGHRLRRQFRLCAAPRAAAHPDTSAWQKLPAVRIAHGIRRNSHDKYARRSANWFHLAKSEPSSFRDEYALPAEHAQSDVPEEMAGHLQQPAGSQNGDTAMQRRARQSVPGSAPVEISCRSHLMYKQ